MITASHNPAQDNGVKITTFDGTMLEQNWEPHCENIVNADIPSVALQDVMEKMGVPMSIFEQERYVFLGHDTRTHSK
jgi:phosphomannomutase